MLRSLVGSEMCIRDSPSINQINGYLETVKDGDIIGNDIEVVNEELSCMTVSYTHLTLPTIYSV